MKKVEKLTSEQIAKFPEYVKKWTDIGLSTQPADRPRAEAAIRYMYRAAKLPAPRIIWTTSPLVSGLARAILNNSVWASVGASVGDSVRDSVWDSVWASVRASVRDSVWASVGASVRDSVWASVGASVWASVRDSVRDSVGASVRASVGDSVRDSVGASVRDSVRASVYGQHDAGWLAFHRYFYEQCGLRNETKKLAGLWELCQSAGWILPHKNICWVSERHSTLNRDDRGRLHSVDSPALAYPDGWALYYWHGIAVTEKIIMQPESITVEQIDTEENAEVRRVMVEQYNRVRGDDGAFIRYAGGVKVDTAPAHGVTLWQRRDVFMLEMINATPEPDGSRKRYWMRVDPTRYGGEAGRNARAAVASTWAKVDSQNRIQRDDYGKPVLIFDDWRDYAPTLET